jgi:putative Mg2+ transporter-C (MgtC) family protein
MGINMDFIGSLFIYWNHSHIQANILIVLNLLGALILGLILGYERSYHGRAAGMRTYGLVCMASAGIVLVSGYSGLWYGSQFLTHFQTDPTRSIQGIVTGIGFLCAGVIMKEGFSISGLTTAASIWTVSAVGILVGLGLYAAAIFMVFGAIICMTSLSDLEAKLPSRPAVAVMLRFKKNHFPSMQAIQTSVGKRGYRLAQGSISIAQNQGHVEWHFVALAIDRALGANLPNLSDELSVLEGVEDFRLSHARN